MFIKKYALTFINDRGNTGYIHSGKTHHMVNNSVLFSSENDAIEHANGYEVKGINFITVTTVLVKQSLMLTTLASMAS